MPDKGIKPEIWKVLEPFIRNTHPIISTMAKAEEREMIFYPPHYSNLQPIKIVWANIKGGVGQKYTTHTTFKDVLVSLKESFTHLDSHTLKVCINQSNQKLKYLHRHIVDIENGDEDEYINKDVYESENDGKNNFNDDSSNGEAND